MTSSSNGGQIHWTNNRGPISSAASMPPTPGRRGEPKQLGQSLAVRGQHPPASPRCRGALTPSRRGAGDRTPRGHAPAQQWRLHHLHSAILRPLGAARSIEVPSCVADARVRRHGIRDVLYIRRATARTWRNRQLNGQAAGIRAAPLPRALNRHRTSQQGMCSPITIGSGRTLTGQRFRWSEPVWSPPPESNRRPHPYHRCAGGSQRRTAPHVPAQARRLEGLPRLVS
jgi:hypothetical protein